MKLHSLIFRNSLLFSAVILLLGAQRVAGQATADASTSFAQTSAVPARITQAIDETQLVRLRGNVHPLARPEFDHGAVEDWQPMKRMLLLLQRSPEQEAALQKLMEEQQSKDSPNFHKWLTPQQFGAQFGPADADTQTVKDWLTRQGFQSIKVGAGRTTIEFSGTVAQVRNAFHTQIHRYLVKGETRQANSADPQIPAALTPVVAGIVTLHNFPRKSFRHFAGAFTRTADGRIVPQFTGTDSSGTFYAVGPADFATIYSVPTAPNGMGVVIGIVADSNINPQDVLDFRNLFGLSANFSLSNIIVNGPDPGKAAGEGEADLDVQVAGMVAQNATINLVVSEDTTTALGPDLSALYIIDNNIAPVLSESFGACEAALGTAGNQFYSALWEQAAAQGITAVIAAGDPGSAGCDDFNTEKAATLGLAVSGFASTPFNVAVGGTDFDDVGTQTNFWNAQNSTDGKRESAKGYIPETTWNNSCAAAAKSSTLNTVCATANNIVGGSGGPSNCSASTVVGTTVTCTGGYARPSWQSGVSSASTRAIPDVSLFASVASQSKSFYVVCQADALQPGSPPSCASSGSFSFFGVGGTSASTPAFAGIMALLNQTNGRQGNPNPVLYKIAGTAGQSCNSSTAPLTGSTCSFYDITKGNNSVPCVGGSLNCSSTSASTNGVLVDPASATTPAWTTKAGYDLATGLGSVNVTNLAAQWTAAVGTFKGTTTATKINNGTATVTITHGTPVNLSATVTSAVSGTPTGDVSFLAPTSVNGGIGAATLSGGTATLPSTSLPGGSYNVKAHYAGDGTFAPSDDLTGVSVVVNKEPSILQIGIVTFDPVTGRPTSANSTNFAYGSPYIFRMDILNSKGTATNCQPITTGVITGCAIDATGTVTATDGAAPLDAGTFPINSLGHAEDQPIQLAPGTHNLSASYSGDISYNAPASPTTDTVTVTKATTNTRVVASPSTITTATAVTLTATIITQSNGAAPTGTVQFLNGSTPISGTVTYTGQSGAQSLTGFATLTATITTTLSVLPVGPGPRAPLPFAPLFILVCVLVILALLVLRLSQNRRRRYVYATMLLLAAFATAVTGCNNSAGSSAHTISITAQYSGDTNYSASSGTTSVTKQ
jgi:hypothetical protein